MSNKINKILKATENFESFMLKKAGGPVAAALGTALIYYGAATLTSMFISAIAARVRATKSLLDTVDKALENLTEYKEDYGDEDWFAPFSKRYDEFLNHLENLKSSGEVLIKSAESQQTDSSLIPTLERFLQSLEGAERLASGVSGFLETNKSWGKALDVGSSIGLGFGLETDAVSAQAAIGAFYQFASYERLKYQDMLKDIAEKAKSKTSKEQSPASSSAAGGEEVISENIALESTKPKSKPKSESVSSLEDYADIL